MPAKSTKVLLIEDDVNSGYRSGEIVPVKPGYARNYLIPEGIAVVADKKALRMQERLKEARLKKAEQDRSEALEQAKILEGPVVTKVVKVDQEGHMYGSVSVADLVHLIEEAHQVTLEKRSVLLKHPIKEVGVFTIHLKLKEDVSCAFTLKVLSEAAAAEAAAAPAAQ